MAYERAHHGQRSSDTAMKAADCLGWFSIGLGLAELVAPTALARWLGMRGSERTIQVYGLREIATGIGILSADNPAPWLWGRVAGDALDMATLMPALREDNPQRSNAAIAMGAVAGAAVLDTLTANALSGQETRQERRLRLQAMIEDYRRRSGLPRPPDEMRGAAQDFEIPGDYRTPAPLRPKASGRSPDAAP